MPLTLILETRKSKSICPTTEKTRLTCSYFRMLANVPVFVAVATVTIALGTAATRRPAAATSGAPTVAASAWASSRSGARPTTNTCALKEIIYKWWPVKRYFARIVGQSERVSAIA